MLPKPSLLAALSVLSHTLASSTPSPPVKPPCDASFKLTGDVSIPTSPLKALLPCSALDPSAVFVFLNGKPHTDFQATPSSIDFPHGLIPSSSSSSPITSPLNLILTIIAADVNGYPLSSSFSLHDAAASPAPSPIPSPATLESTCPMTSPSCQNPQPRQCTFYRDCVEASIPCANSPSSYAINYGLANCQKFEHNLDLFSPAGNDFIFGVMTCLQRALVPVVQGCNGVSCQTIHDAAFAAHPGCYVANGFCTLQCSDYLAELYVVGLDLFSSDAMRSVFHTVEGCLANIVQVIKEGACMDPILQKILLTALELLA